MRSYFILILLCFNSLIVFGQKLQLEKASPFTAVKWEADQPIIQFENEWYQFEKLDHFSKKVILDFCKQEFGTKWQKRFSEDLVEVLQGLNYQPNVKVKLQLSKQGVSKTYIGTFTLENRQRSLQYNKSIEEAKFPQKLSPTQALEDLSQFEEILSSISSYSQLSNFDYKSAIRKLSASILSKNEEVDVNAMVNEMGKIMAEIGDRHSSIKNEVFSGVDHETYRLKLPFGLATIEGEIVALKQNLKDNNYDYYYNEYPYIKSIDGVAIETLINNYNYRDTKAPQAAKMAYGSAAVQKYGELLFKNNLSCPDSVTVVFTNGENERTETVKLTTDEKGYNSKLLEENYRNRTKVENGDFHGLSKILAHNIGYIHIPEMYHYDNVEGLEDFIETTLTRFSETKALIIDVRDNPGGGREILQTIASYIMQPEQSPWVANVAYLRTDEFLNADEESMSGRYLYSYHSDKLTDQDRTAIDQFNSNFKLRHTFDRSKFSSPFYMVLHNDKEPYSQPVYILVNEGSFSAATVFTSAFKGLPNVKIVGETTDGSSGNSIQLHLKHSNIRVKVSTMLSFQRNGKTLDGNGTLPDLIIPADVSQVLRGLDNQLMSLVEMINRR